MNITSKTVLITGANQADAAQVEGLASLPRPTQRWAMPLVRCCVQ